MSGFGLVLVCFVVLCCDSVFFGWLESLGYGVLLGIGIILGMECGMGRQMTRNTYIYAPFTWSFDTFSFFIATGQEVGSISQEGKYMGEYVVCSVLFCFLFLFPFPKNIQRFLYYSM